MSRTATMLNADRSSFYVHIQENVCDCVLTLLLFFLLNTFQFTEATMECCPKRNFWFYDSRYNRNRRALCQHQITSGKLSHFWHESIQFFKINPTFSRLYQLINDVQNHPNFNREIDKRTGYRTLTMLCVPVIHIDGSLVGVCQLINKKVSR